MKASISKTMKPVFFDPFQLQGSRLKLFYQNRSFIHFLFENSRCWRRRLVHYFVDVLFIVVCLIGETNCWRPIGFYQFFNSSCHCWKSEINSTKRRQTHHWAWPLCYVRQYKRDDVKASLAFWYFMIWFLVSITPHNDLIKVSWNCHWACVVFQPSLNINGNRNYTYNWALLFTFSTLHTHRKQGRSRKLPWT